MTYYYNFDAIPDTMITPRRTNNRGKTYTGKHIILQRIITDEDRGDGQGLGAQTHSHPEEQIFIAISGTMKIRIEDEWFTMGPGDVVVIPPDVVHEEICEGEFIWYSIKSRIPGHSWHTTEWAPGAEKDWQKVKELYDEMDQKYIEEPPAPLPNK